MRYALRIVVGMIVVWALAGAFGVAYAIWAMVSVVLVGEIEPHATRGRIARTAA